MLHHVAPMSSQVGIIVFMNHGASFYFFGSMITIPAIPAITKREETIICGR